MFRYDAVFSDHMPVLFDFNLPCHSLKPCAPVRHCHSTTAQFSSVFFAENQLDTRPSALLDTEQLTSTFLSTCASTLDTVAPLKIMHPRPKSEPWLNDTTRAARRECRRAECRWKKDKLHVFMCLKESWRKYNIIYIYIYIYIHIQLLKQKKRSISLT